MININGIKLKQSKAIIRLQTKQCYLFIYYKAIYLFIYSFDRKKRKGG